MESDQQMVKIMLMADIWLGFKISLTSRFVSCSLGGPGWLPGGRLGAGTTPQDHGCYPIQYQPDWLHPTLIREGFWLGLGLKQIGIFVKQPDVSHALSTSSH